ncbi:hypothetical protein C4D60_Mb02t15310 [Musa balbisiana]|uniref:Uncharacterized protein n=1 Tax=Musa balbisiana TaxID=52838 RepID=A0A4V6T3Z3_MUSBA|nr:hypothetical protein C4D60_Mb02t15310 [Musa balbisiana]
MQEGEMPSPKKQCGGSRATKNKQSPSKHPQGAAAKNALGFFKILCSMEQRPKAINYVKFLQMQVKVLETDEFRSAQGGKAAEVKDAIDIIFSTHRGRNI